MLTLLGILALSVAVLGGLALVASSQIEPSEDGGVAIDTDTTGGKVASFLEDGLRRTGQAVDVLVDPRPDTEVLRDQEPPVEHRRATYVVMGAGLLGLAVVLALGVVLVLSA